MMLSMAGFVVNDTFMKAVLADLPLFTAVFWRGVLVTCAMAVLCWRAQVFRMPPRRDRRFMAQRIGSEILTTVCFLTALANMPIAAATAILQSLPLAVTLAAALFLAEPVGWRRLLASAIGFCGVLMIVRPGGADFNPYALFAVAAVFLIVIRDLSTRRLSKDVPSLLVALITAVVITLTGLIGSGGAALAAIPVAHLPALGGAAAFLIVGYVFSVSAMRHGEIDFVSPFRYTILIWAILLGIAVFGEIPDGWTIAGSVVIVATGLFTFYRERLRGGLRARPAGHERAPQPRPNEL